MSPTTLTLLAASVGSSVWAFLVLLAVNVFVFLSGVGKSKKKLVVGLLIPFLVPILLISAGRFQTLKQMNDYSVKDVSPSELQEWEEFLAYLGYNLTINLTTPFGGGLRDPPSLGERLFGKSVDSTATDYVLFIPSSNGSVGRIGLEEAIQNGSYKVFSVDPFGREIAANSSPSHFGSLKYVPYSKGLFQDLTRMFNLTPEDAVVFYCHGGHTSRLIALIFAYHGYNAKFSTTMDIPEGQLLQSSTGDAEDRVPIVVDVLSPEEGDTYLYLVFRSDDFSFLEEEGFWNSLEGDVVVARAIDVNPPEGFTPSINYSFRELGELELADMKILCRDRFHCPLTLQYLYLSNTTGITKIYQVEDETHH